MNVEIANKLVKLRKQLGLSQEELAEKIGVSRQAVSKWERSESSPDTDNLIALSKIYNISIDEMLDHKAPGMAESNVSKQNLTSDNEPTNTPLHDDDNTSAETNKKSKVKVFPIAIVATLIFLCLGMFFDLWHPGWLVFLVIPLFHYVVPNNRRRGNSEKVIGWRLFPYPILAVIIFLLLGFLFDGWVYAWLIFLTIPIWAYFTVK